MQISNATFRYGATLKNKTARDQSNYISVVSASFLARASHGTKPTHPKKSLKKIFCATVFYFFVSLPSLHFAVTYLHPVEQTRGDSGKNNNDTAHPPFGRGDSMPYHYYFIVVLYHFSMKNDTRMRALYTLNYMYRKCAGYVLVLHKKNTALNLI